MPIESAGDRAAFFDAGEFGALVLWTTSSGAFPEYPALWVNHTMTLDEFEGPGALNTASVLLFAVESLPGDAVAGHGVGGDLVAITDPVSGIVQQFRAKSIEPDGTGMVRVTLERVIG